MGKWGALVKGALLHDIGKVVYRANQGTDAHSKRGAAFIEPYFSDMGLKQSITHCLKYHHGKELSAAQLKNDDYAYIVYEADNIAAAVDRRDLEEGENTSTQKFDKELPLQSIFRVFGGKTSTQPLQYYLRGIDVSDHFNYPESDKMIRASSDKYKALYDVLVQNFQQQPIDKMSVNELLRIYEDTVSYMPSSTATDQANDISLYMHSKITAAVAHSMVHYFEDQGITDYKEYCYQNSKKFREMSAFRLISGDISGIQNFIYTIPSKGALKSLRGRSFYLEILMEQIVDELLDSLQLTRANLIYNGGGHFYVLAPNTTKTCTAIESMEKSINEWFLTVFGTKLYLAFGSATATAAELIQSQRTLFRKVSQSVSEAKAKRYSEQHLTDLFNPNSTYNTVLHGERECSICHTSTATLSPYGKDTDAEACPICNGLYRLGEQIVDSRDTVFVLASLNTSDDSESIPKVEVYVNNLNSDADNLKLYLYVVPEASLQKFESGHDIFRIYSKNTAKTGHNVFNRIWLADYVARKDNGQVYEFEELAASSGLGDDKGIKRLGVLRADVDNLGAAFIGGFISEGSDKFKYGTLSRYADLSRDLAMFFKVAVNKMAQGDVQGFGRSVIPFTIWANKKVTTRKTHVIYSGGDDVFLVGAWDELLELAIDIREKLAEVTDNKITMSAGLALFSPSYPISQMAAITGLLESVAKDNEGKDSIALFGFETNKNASGEERICRHVYKWDELIDNVIEDKIYTLDQLFVIPGINENQNSKMKLGKGLIYKLMELLQGVLNDRALGKHINVARILYLLARLEPKKDNPTYESYKNFVTAIHRWIQSEEDCKALLTACNLIVYYMRDTK